jgi:hypothetical protein
MAIPIMSSLKYVKLTNLVGGSQIGDKFGDTLAIDYGCKDIEKVEDLRTKIFVT